MWGVETMERGTKWLKIRATACCWRIFEIVRCFSLGRSGWRIKTLFGELFHVFFFSIRFQFQGIENERKHFSLCFSAKPNWLHNFNTKVVENQANLLDWIYTSLRTDFVLEKFVFSFFWFHTYLGACLRAHFSLCLFRWPIFWQLNESRVPIFFPNEWDTTVTVWLIIKCDSSLIH